MPPDQFEPPRPSKRGKFSLTKTHPMDPTLPDVVGEMIPAGVGGADASPDSRLLCWSFGGWEPDRHYRRLGSQRTPILGHGRWLNDWRLRINSPATLRLARDAGINLLITHFYKGFGVKVEAAEWPRVREFVRACHELQIQAWGYVQGGSLYPETLFEEQPEARDWSARNPDGSVQTCRGTYYRLMPCWTSPGYLNYMEQVIRSALLDYQFDGIHLDNSYLSGCYCRRCAEAFRDWLERQSDLEQRTGLPHARHVQPPPLKPDQQRFSDPLQILWMEFNVRLRLTVLSRWKSMIHALKPGSVLHSNPGAVAFQPAPMARRSVDPAREGLSCDWLCFEMLHLPGVDGDRCRTLAPAYLCAEAAGHGSINASWNGLPDGSSFEGPRSAGEVWTGLAEEFSHCRAALGAQWFLQPSEDGEGILGDDPVRRAALRDAVQFFQGLQDSLSLAGRQQWAEVGLLIDTRNMTLDAERCHDSTLAMLQELLHVGVPVRLLLDDATWPDELRHVIVWAQRCLSDRRIARLREFTRLQRRAVWIDTVSGESDEWHLPRSRSDRAENFSGPGFERLLGATPDTAVADWLRRAMLRLRILLPAGTLANVEQAKDGRLLVHVRDLDSRQMPVHGAAVLGAAQPTLARQHRFRYAAAEIESSGRRIDLQPFLHYTLLETTKTNEMSMIGTGPR